MVVRGLASLGASWDTEGDASAVEENLPKPISEARGLAFAGLRDFLVGANVADANILAALLGCIVERGFCIGSRGPERKANRRPERFGVGRTDCLGEVRNHRTFYGNWRGSRAVQGFKLRWTSLYIEVLIYRLVTSLGLDECCHWRALRVSCH